MPDPAISLVGVTKRFDSVTAVNEVSLDVAEGEFFTLLGPSGCGKSTTLRMIAGLDQPTGGRILLRGQDVTNVPPNRRSVNMVFQNYALFPHINVYENVAFGLKLKKVPKAEVRSRVEEMLEIVALSGLEKRRPHQLSGGQQQRVALARALINRPAALLLDEPLGALDVKLRKALQLELKRIQRETQATFVYVTHDQEEALTMSDRIAVMSTGVAKHIGTPREIYEHPASTFVADFVGALNILDFTVDETDGAIAVDQLDQKSRIVVPVAPSHRLGDQLKVAVRPERIRIEPANDSQSRERGSCLEGTVAEVVYLGVLTHFHIDTQVGRLVSHQINADESTTWIEVGARVALSWAPEYSSILSTAE